MKTTEHTPGPWAIGRNYAWDKNVDVRTIDGDSVAFCQKLNEADARLIAAAPELLEACQQLLDAYNGTSIPEVDQAMLFASEAIAKATGTTP